MLSYLSLLALAGIVAASKPGLLFGRDTYSGVATFNDYAAQGSTVCGPKSGTYLLSDCSPINDRSPLPNRFPLSF